VSIRQEPLYRITKADVKREGGYWKDRMDYINSWIENYPESNTNELIWRIAFEVVEKKEDV